MRLLPYLIYALSIFVGAALLAFPLWGLLHAVGLESVPFHKLCFRLLEALALLGLWPLMRFLGLKSAADWGFSQGRAGCSPVQGLVIGFLWGVGLLALIVVILIALETRTFRADIAWDVGSILSVAAKAAVAGLVIAVIEETWFRGALFPAILARFPVGSAIGTTAFLYALVHFIRPDVQVPAADVDWTSGVTVILGSFGRFSSVDILDSLSALFAVGVLLALVRHHTGRIWECIGLHTGFVVIIRLTRKLTEAQPESAFAWLAGGFDGVIGWLGLSIFTLTVIAYWRINTDGPPSNA